MWDVFTAFRSAERVAFTNSKTRRRSIEDTVDVRSFVDKVDDIESKRGLLLDDKRHRKTSVLLVSKGLVRSPLNYGRIEEVGMNKLMIASLPRSRALVLVVVVDLDPGLDLVPRSLAPHFL